MLFGFLASVNKVIGVHGLDVVQKGVPGFVLSQIFPTSEKRQLFFGQQRGLWVGARTTMAPKFKSFLSSIIREQKNRGN